MRAMFPVTRRIRRKRTPPWGPGRGAGGGGEESPDMHTHRWPRTVSPSPRGLPRRGSVPARALIRRGSGPGALLAHGDAPRAPGVLLTRRDGAEGPGNPRTPELAVRPGRPR